MRRGAWFVAGAGVGVWSMLRARRAAEALTPDGARDRLSGLRLGARMLAEEFTAGADAKQDELRERLGLQPPGPPAVAPAPLHGPRAAPHGDAPASIQAPSSDHQHSQEGRP